MKPCEFISQHDATLRKLTSYAAGHFATTDAAKVLCATPFKFAFLLNTALSASLVTEESKFHELGLAVGYASWSGTFDATNEAHFSTPREFSASQLAKLAPTCHGHRLILLLGNSAQSGVVVTAIGFEPFACIVKIVVTGAGALSIFIMNRLKAIFTVTSGLVDVGDAFKSDLAGYIWAALDRNIGNDAASRPIGNVLSKACSAAAALGRGGTILVVPQTDSRWRKSVDLSSALVFDKPIHRLAKALEDILQLSARVDEQWRARVQGEHTIEKNWRELQAARSRLTSASLYLTSLSTIDGAVVINDRLAVYASGAKITAPAPKLLDRLVDMNPNRDDTHLGHGGKALGGTRHSSAASFVAANKMSIAIVISQDGRVSLITWDKSRKSLKRLRLDDLVAGAQRD